MSKKYLFKDIVKEKDGFLRGPFGGDLKKEIFVEKRNDTYKVYEQGVVLNSDKNIGKYYISKNDYLNKLYKFAIQNNDFLVSCSGMNMGAIYQLKEPFEKGIINQALLRIRLNNEIIDDSFFLYLFKKLISKKITTGSGDSTIPNFPGLNIIKNIELEIPNIDIQQKIGVLLSTLDAKIELNNRINTELESMAKILYDYWFVQFDFPCLLAYGEGTQAKFQELKKYGYKGFGGLPAPQQDKYFVYVLKLDNGHRYIGQTSFLLKRYDEHINGKGSNYTKVHKPVKIIHWEEFQTREEAVEREKWLKTGYGRTWLDRQEEKNLLRKAGGKMVYNPDLKREIPEGWEVVKVVDLIDTNKNGDWGKEVKQGNYNLKVSCIRGTDLNGINGLEICEPPQRFILEKNINKILNSNDLVIEISGGSPTQSTGRLAFISDATLKRFENPLICSNFCRAISLKNKKILYNFVYFWNNLYNKGAFFGYEGKTTGIKNFLFDIFANSNHIAIPETSIIENFYEIIQSLQFKKQSLLLENQTLSSLRDWLLPMLMNGQVKVG